MKPVAYVGRSTGLSSATSGSGLFGDISTAAGVCQLRYVKGGKKSYTAMQHGNPQNSHPRILSLHLLVNLSVYLLLHLSLCLSLHLSFHLSHCLLLHLLLSAFHSVSQSVFYFISHFFTLPLNLLLHLSLCLLPHVLLHLSHHLLLSLSPRLALNFTASGFTLIL